MMPVTTSLTAVYQFLISRQSTTRQTSRDRSLNQPSLKTVRFRSPCFALIADSVWMLVGICLTPSFVEGDEQTPPRTHPLMPGIVSSELHNRAWPRTYHDKLVTGFSPLTRGTTADPAVWATVRYANTVEWTYALRNEEGGDELLVFDGVLRLVTATGDVRWMNATLELARSASAAVLYYGDLRGDGTTYLLLGNGSYLAMVNASTGNVEWEHDFSPSYVALVSSPQTIAIADLLPDRPGNEAAVFPLYSERGYLIGFPPIGDPEIIWDRLVIVPGEHAPGPGGGERADHGCWTEVDLSDPEAPVIWNVRHHRCRGFAPRTGEMISSLVYDIGGTHKRNYGPARLGVGPAGERLMCVVGQAVQFHVHAIELNRGAPSELLWQEYYGELLLSGNPGRRALRMVAIDDLDQDGATEIAYNLTDEAHNFRPVLVVRDAASGEVEDELADCTCVRAVISNDEDTTVTWLVVRPTQGHPIPTSDLLLYRNSSAGQWEQVAHWPQTSLWGPTEIQVAHRNDLLIRQHDAEVGMVIRQIALEADGPRIVAETRAAEVVNLSHLQTLRSVDGSLRFIAAPIDGAVRAYDWSGVLEWTLEVSGGAPPILSAADLDGDGRCELLAATPTDQLLHVYAFDDEGTATELRTHSFRSFDPRPAVNPLVPLVYDLKGNGTPAILCPTRNASGHGVIRAFDGHGELLWETVLDADEAGPPPSRWHVGEFLPGPRAGVVVSSQARQGESIQGTYMLDGKTGEILWQKAGYLEAHGISLPYYPMGVPTAFDLDGDRVEEIGMDFYCYMAWLRGADGEILRLHHTANLGEQGALFAGRFHNSYIPFYPAATSGSPVPSVPPHWFVPVGLHGSVGLMKPDPTAGIWREELGYDMPQKVGLIDIDGDGRMEVGYAARSGRNFKCRDLATGEIEWQFELPEPVPTPIVSADFDGDGRGEFLVGRYCLGLDQAGDPRVLWELPAAPLRSLVADFDGDGHGEIAGVAKGRIQILK